MTGILTQFRYSRRHTHFYTLHHSFRYDFTAYRTLPYHWNIFQSVNSVLCLAPVNFRRGDTRLVSCYALFKWWLLLSQHPSCLCISTSFNTQHKFRDLIRRSGLFPFWPWNLSPTVWLPDILDGIRSLRAFSTARCGHHTISALPPPSLILTLVLKLFRGEPAITEFDWNFTTSHKSSAGVSTNVGSVLRWVVPQFQPAHG